MIPYPEHISAQRLLFGFITAVVSFGLLGTVSALWQNPLFIRMTPTSGFEISLLALLSLGLGAYVTVRRSYCSNKGAGSGGVLGFLGIACPVCNKILLLIFGGEILLTYYEPVRVYVAAAGVLIVVWVLVRELRAQGQEIPAL